MYPHDKKRDKSIHLDTVITYVKIGISICLMLLAVLVTVWSIETVDKVLKSSEDVALIQTFMDYQSEQSVLDISINNDRIIVKNNNTLKFIILLLILIVLFNIIGKAITAIFKSLATIVTSLELKKIKAPQKDQDKDQNA